MATSTTNTSTPAPFTPPSHYSFPPFFTPQPTLQTRQAQLGRWSKLIQAYCRHHRIFCLNLATALDSPLFHNTAIHKRISLQHAKDIIDFMASSSPSSSTTLKDGGGGGGDGLAHAQSSSRQEPPRAEWTSSDKTSAWIWWRTPEEWADLISAWIEQTGQKNVVLTLYELVEGDGNVGASSSSSSSTIVGHDFYGLDRSVLQRSLAVLVKRGQAQVFGSDGQEGVKFF